RGSDRVAGQPAGEGLRLPVAQGRRTGSSPRQACFAARCVRSRRARAHRVHPERLPNRSNHPRDRTRLKENAMPLNLSGQLGLLRVHDVGTGYGPPSDQLDVEVIVQFVGRPNDAFGFQLRTDDNQPVREGMLALLRDGFNRGWTVWIDYDIDPGKHNGTII